MTSDPLPASKLNVKKTHQIASFKHDAPLTCCRVDPSGKFAFAGAEDLRIHRWEIEGGTKTSLVGHQSWVRSMDFSRDGQWMYSGGYDDHIGVWETSAERTEPQKMLKAHRGWVRWVRVNRDGTLLASCGNDNLVKIWSLPDLKLKQTLQGHQRYPYAVAFHPDGKRVVSFDLMGVIKEWDLTSGKMLRELEAKFMWGFDKKFRADMGGARDMQFSSDGKTLAVAGLTEVTNAFAGVHKPMILLIDWEKGKHQHRFKDSSSGLAWGVRFHPQGFVMGVGAPQGGSRGKVWFWKPGEAKPFHTLKLSHCGRGIDLLPDPQRFAVAQFDGHLRVFQMTAKS